MEIIVGKYSGFCAGVNFTYNKAKDEIKKGRTYCLGEIIHNNLVIKELEEMGMITVSSINEIPENSRVIFRAHGEPLKSYTYARKHNIEVIDLTCGKVKVIHNKVLKERDNSFILIIGKKTHPEIVGTVGFCNDNYYVIENISDIENSYKKFIKSKQKKVYIISQTTFSSKLFDEFILRIIDIYKDIEIKVDKTICDATEKRQNEVFDISKKCSIVLVLGSKNSSNTMELYNIAISNCNKVYFIENERDIQLITFKENDIVGVFAGASAPKHFIDKIVSLIENKKI